MYSPAHFVVEDAETIRSFVRENGFGILVSVGEKGIEETHTPMFLSDDGKTLFGHVARANEQWKDWASAPKVKAIFHGPHGYVSPRFYRSSFNVPTWNYTAVSVSGKIAVLDDFAAQKECLHRLIGQYEGDRPDSWRLDESDERMMKLFGAIVCFRVSIESIEAKFKLNQNKSPEDQASVIGHLRGTGDPMSIQVAALMEKNRGSIS